MGDASLSVLLLHWGDYPWAHNLWVLIIYLFFLPFMLPSVVPRLTTDSALRVFPGIWKLLSFLRLPSWDGAPSQDGSLSLPLLSLFLSFIFFPTSFEDNGLLFWVPDVLCQNSEVDFVEFTQRSNVLLMNLWGRKWFPRPIPPLS